MSSRLRTWRGVGGGGGGRWIADFGLKECSGQKAHLLIWKTNMAYVTPCKNDLFPITENRALIGRELCLIREKTTEMRWWWRYLFFSFSRARHARDSPSNFNGNGRQNCQCYCKKKICSETTRLRLVVPLEFWTLWRLCLIRVQTMKNGDVDLLNKAHSHVFL